MCETAHFKCNIKQSARLSQRILCNEARECPCNSLQPFRTLKDYFTEGSSGVCVWGIGSKQNTGVSKANSASSHIWLKTKLRIDPESLERESRCIDASIFSPTPSVTVTVGMRWTSWVQGNWASLLRDAGFQHGQVSRNINIHWKLT